MGEIGFQDHLSSVQPKKKMWILETAALQQLDTLLDVCRDFLISRSDEKLKLSPFNKLFQIKVLKLLF